SSDSGLPRDASIDAGTPERPAVVLADVDVLASTTTATAEHEPKRAIRRLQRLAARATERPRRSVEGGIGHGCRRLRGLRAGRIFQRSCLVRRTPLSKLPDVVGMAGIQCLARGVLARDSVGKRTATSRNVRARLRYRRIVAGRDDGQRREE